MEISILSNASLKVKGKHAALVIDPQEKGTYNAAILSNNQSAKAGILEEDTVIINGPGEYEVGGIKIKGTNNVPDVLYSITIDGIEILLGKLHTLDKMQHKLQDHNIVIVYCEDVIPAAFLMSLASNVVMFYGEKAAEISQSFGQENVTKMQKYTTTLDKLPQEVETVLLS